MKKLFIIAAMLLVCNFVVLSNDTTSVKLEGKNIIVQTSKKQKTPDVNTGYTYEIKGVKYPVYKTARGKYYILKTSKRGNQYKMYITDKVNTLIK